MDPSDAPYSVVALFWTMGGISTRFWLVLSAYLFREVCSRKSLEALNGEGAVQFAFRHVSFACWARDTKWCFVSSARGFEDLKRKKKFHFASFFPPLVCFSLVRFLSPSLHFSGEFFLSVFFSGLVPFGNSGSHKFLVKKILCGSVPCG